MSKIFISYRRSDSDAMTGRMYDRLLAHYGDDSIFMDIDAIPFGIDFRTHILDVLANTDVLLAIVGPKWLGRGDSGYHRIMEENDFVRMEIEAALDRGVPIVPVLINGTSMPQPNNLPERIREFSFRNAALVDGGFKFHSHMDQLIRSLDQILAKSRAKKPSVPDQSPAPVRVEEREGKITQISLKDSSLNASEQDFNEWRDFVIDHVSELSSHDFREGTNHGRARDRLVALGKLLPGEMSEVKKRQFRIGYEIERFEGLLTAYRSGGDDMPELNAAVLEDLNRLLSALKLGLNKLERWSEFQRSAADDFLKEGDADKHQVSDALEKIAEKMEQHPKHFEPELPASFRFLVEAMGDPAGATRTVVYGAVKSTENLISFLGQRALGIGKRTTDTLEKNISKAVATSLLLMLGSAALQVSGALPAGWVWLKPLLEALSKGGIG